MTRQREQNWFTSGKTKILSVFISFVLLFSSFLPYATAVQSVYASQENQTQSEQQAPEVTSSQDSSAPTSSEPSITTEPQPTEAPSSPTVDEVLTPPTDNIVPLSDLLEEPKNNSPPISEDSASIVSVVTKSTSDWTFEKVELGKEYVAPQNDGVKLTFTKLPSPAGNIKIEEITLTEDQIKQTGSLSDKAYDITSDMKDGDFTYDLSLPIPEASKGKDVQVKFAEELSKIGSADKVENTLTKTDTSVSVTSLDHFTIFVVTGGLNPSCSSVAGTIVGGATIQGSDQCYSTIQAAIDVAVSGETINVADGTYNEALNITKSLTIIGNIADPSAVVINTGALTGFGSPRAGIYTNQSSVTLRGFTVNGGGQATSTNPRYGISFSGTTGGTVQNVVTQNFSRTGLNVTNAATMTFDHVTAKDNGGSGIGTQDLKDTTISNITTSNNLWGGLRIETKSRSVSGIVINGINSFGENGSGPLYLHPMHLEPILAYPITYGYSGTPDVLIQSADFAYILSGTDDDPLVYKRVHFYKTYDDAMTAAQAPNGTVAFHILEAGRYVKEIATGHFKVKNPLKIQAAIGSAITNDVIDVATGTYIEVGQIVIDKNLSIVGADTVTTIIKTDRNTGTDGDERAWFLVDPSITFNLSNVTLDGTSLDVTAYKVREAIRHHGNGDINNVAFRNIKYGTYLGTAININSIGNVDVTDSTFSNIERVGVLFTDAATSTLSGNTYTGKGPGDWLDYAFETQWGAKVTINNNTISDNTGTGSGEDSAGISVWDDSGTVVLTNNHLNNNHIGVAVAVSGFGGPTDPVVTIGDGNVFNGGDIGVDLEQVDAGAGLNSGSPTITFGASIFKGVSTAINIMDGISVGKTIDIRNVIFKDSSDVVITASSAIENLVWHLIDASNRGLLKWDYVAPSVPVGGLPNATAQSTNNFDFTWDASSDVSAVTYEYQATLNPAAVDGVLTTGLWNSGVLSTATIHSSGAANGKWYWQVRATDSYGNVSAWSEIWNVTIDSTAPSAPGTPSTTTPTNSTTQTWSWTAATDGLSGIASYAWRVVGGTSGEVLGATTSKVTNLLDGIWNFFVKAIDNAGNQSSETSGSVTVDATAPAVPTHVSPLDNSFITTAGLTLVDWSDVTDSISPPVSYIYQSSTSSATNLDGSFVSPAYTSGSLSVSQISTAGTSAGVYYWHVRSADALGNTSAWSTPWKVTVDNVAPTVDLVFPVPGPSATSFQAVFSEDVNPTEAENPANYFLNNWPGAGGSGDLVGDATVSYSFITRTATVSFTNAGWYISPEQQWGVQNVHDLAGNLQQVNSYEEYSTPLANPVTTDSGTDTNWHNSNVTVTLSCADTSGSGCSKTHYTTDGSAPTTSSSFGNSVTLSTDGTYTIKYFSVDNAGNHESVKTADNTVKIDKTAPTEPTASPAAGSYTTDQLVTLASTDALSTVDKIYYTTDGSTPDDSKTVYTGAITADHDMTIKAIAYDLAGNTSSVLSAAYEIAPTISTEGLLPGDPNSAIVFWTTDEASTSRVVYDTVQHPVLGSAPNYGYAFSTVEQDAAPKVTYHQVNITGLNNDTVYYYRVISHGSPDQVGADRNFKTNTAPGTPASSNTTGTPSSPSSSSDGSTIASVGTGEVQGANTFTDEETVLGATDEEPTTSAELEGDVKGESSPVDFMNFNSGKKSFFKSPYLYGLLGLILFIIFIILLKKRKK